MAKDISDKYISIHQPKISLFEKIISGGNIPHALLFSGLEGLGKKDVAIKFAEMILSIGRTVKAENKSEVEFDLFGAPVNPEPQVNTSSIDPEVTAKIAAGTHMDLYLLEKKDEDKKNIGIDEVRAISRFLSLTPGESKFRVAIIDSIDDFNQNSANAILKILEEPTHNTILILLCHATANILPTIKSRCVEIKFAPLSKNDFLSFFNNENDLDDLYKLSGGSPGIAMEIIKTESLESLEKYQRILKEKVININEVISLTKEIKENKSWKIFGNLFLQSYMNDLKNTKDNSKLIKLSEINKIIYSSDFQNMDIQDTLKDITYHITN